MATVSSGIRISYWQGQTVRSVLYGPDSVNEGELGSLLLWTPELAAGSAVPFTFTGISEDDIRWANVSGMDLYSWTVGEAPIWNKLNGEFIVDSDGYARIVIRFLSDSLTEGTETLIVTPIPPWGAAIPLSIRIQDTSKSVLVSSDSNSDSSTAQGGTNANAGGNSNVGGTTAQGGTNANAGGNSNVGGTTASGGTNTSTSGQVETTISQDTTWSGEILLTENVTIEAGCTLTIAAGTTLRGENAFHEGGLKVIGGLGNISFLGTEENKVSVTDLQFHVKTGEVFGRYTDFNNVWQRFDRTGSGDSFKSIEFQESTFLNSKIDAPVGLLTRETIENHCWSFLRIDNCEFLNTNVTVDGVAIVQNSESNVDCYFRVQNIGGSNFSGNTFIDTGLGITNVAGTTTVSNNDFFWPMTPHWMNQIGAISDIRLTGGYDGVEIIENNFHDTITAISYIAHTNPDLNGGDVAVAKGNWFGTMDPLIIADRIRIYDGEWKSSAVSAGWVVNSDWVREPVRTPYIASLNSGQDSSTTGQHTGISRLDAETHGHVIYADSGVDAVVYKSNATPVSKTSSGWVVNGQTLIDVERVEFTDKSIALDLDGNAGNAAKLLGALWGKESVQNSAYVGIVLHFLDSGTSYEDLLDLALGALLGPNKTNNDVAELVYLNLIGEAPTEAVTKELASYMDSGSYSQAAFTRAVADLEINATNIDLVGLANTGLQYEEYIA